MKVFERRIREQVELHDNQYGFRPRSGVMDAMFMLQPLQGKILKGNNKRYWTFVVMEKAFDR